MVVKPLPQKAAPSDLTQSQKVFVRNASLDKAKSQGQQAGGSMLPALNRSQPGLGGEFAEEGGLWARVL